MDIRVLKARLENALTAEVTDDYFREQIRKIAEDLNNEVQVADRTIDAGMVGATVDELRQYYFTLLDEYGALPKTFANLIKRANLLDDMTITISKIINYMSYAISRNAASSDHATQRVCAILKPEMESYRKELFNLGSLMQNVIADKKIYLERIKDKDD